MTWVIGVAVPAPLPRTLDYRCALPAPTPGSRVVVPLGTRAVVGLVCTDPRELADSARLKSIHAVLDPIPLLDPQLLELIRFAASYYHHPIGEVGSTALPSRLRRVEPFLPKPQLAYALTTAGREVAPGALRSARQRELLTVLAGAATLPVEQLRERAPEAMGSLPALLEKGWVERLEFSSLPPPRRAPSLPPLAPQQQAAVERTLAARDRFEALLLEGVTGSGKTEVYLACVQSIVEAGRQALLLVPEIGLTPQFVARLRDRLSVRLGLLHSGLSDGERANCWWQAAHGELDVIVGTRSALFTPLPRLGLIVVDEEQDTSYKQGEGFRYSARDLALKRAQLCQVPILLGSATPALETLRNLELGRLQHCRLDQRFGAAPPALELVDLRKRPCFEGLSDLALTEIKSTLARGEQALVFRNQRGFAPVMVCHDCGWHPDCPDCSRPVTWHKRLRRLQCHHCGYQLPQPAACPQCGSLALRGQGIGTERLESFLGERFPEVPLLRMDADSLGRKQALGEFLDTIARSEAALIVGTQLLAKGHDWPRVTLVVIVDCDGALFGSDFRSGERLAQLVVQVAGRAGRALRPGRVLLQTHQPEHPLLQAILRGGYRAAIRHETAERQAAQFPPYGALALLRAEARTFEAAADWLLKARKLQPAHAGVEIAGPLAAPLERRAGLFRAQLWLQGSTRAALHQDLEQRVPALYQLKTAAGLRWSLDVDPLDLS